MLGLRLAAEMFRLRRGLCALSKKRTSKRSWRRASQAFFITVTKGLRCCLLVELSLFEQWKCGRCGWCAVHGVRGKFGEAAKARSAGPYRP